ncbi:Guanine nucleotide exchange factor lte1, partial [Modicella reniformis]
MDQAEIPTEHIIQGIYHLASETEPETTCGIPSPDTLLAPQPEVSPIPPRYLEIDTRVFDQAGDESPYNIVYAPHETLKHGLFSGTSELRPIIAATIVKLIEKLTYQYGMDFFLTYRLFMSPVQLCKYLIQRYLWALEQDTESRCVVRVRTFVVFRYWINNHFADDFLTSKSLRFQMASFLNNMRSHPRVQSSARDARIIRSLMEFFKQQRRYYKSLAKQSLIAEQRSGSGKRDSQQDVHGVNDSVEAHSKANDQKAAEEERLGVSAIPSRSEFLVAKWTTVDVTSSIRQMTPVKGRHRASTLAGPTPRSIVGEHHDDHCMMTMGFSKLRQKSEDIYQHFVHPSNVPSRGKNCVCWTPAYTGITEHHAFNT